KPTRRSARCAGPRAPSFANRQTTCTAGTRCCNGSMASSWLTTPSASAKATSATELFFGRRTAREHGRSWRVHRKLDGRSCQVGDACASVVLHSTNARDSKAPRRTPRQRNDDDDKTDQTI